MDEPPDHAERDVPLRERLRERLRSALRELAKCRGLLESNGVPFDPPAFSCDPEDHADVLAEEEGEEADDLGLPVRAPAVTGHGALARRPSDEAAPASEELAPAAPEPSPSEKAPATALAVAAIGEEDADASSLDAAAPRSHAGESLPGGGGGTVGEQQPGDAAAAAPAAPSAALPGGAGAGDEAPEAVASAAREKERLEVELSMAKALLMLNNVNVNMDFTQEETPGGSAAEVVNLKGSRHLIQLLLTLKQKVSLLSQQYLLLRGDMLYMNHEMNVCRQWILQSFRMAMQHQSQEHSSLQTRFERLSKVLT